MPDRRRQFRILYRDFLRRMVDLELLSAHGEIQKLLGQFAAMLAAFSFVAVIYLVPRYGMSPLPRERLLILAWSDEEFLIATSMAIAGLFAVLAWNAVFPDRRDSLVLGLLPVRARTIALAKVAALATALGVSIAAVNAFTGLCFPFVVGSGMLGALRSLAAYWAAHSLAGLFVCCSLLAVQGVLSQVLSYRLFLRVSSWAQLSAFFLILGVYFLKPPFPTSPALVAAANRGLTGWLPSFWFLGLFQELNGAAYPVFGPLATRALWSLIMAASVASATFALACGRNSRRIIEQPDIAPADRSRPAALIGGFLAARLLSKPVERAVVMFTARTIARSRQHRLLLAAYAGIGLAIALAYARDLLYGASPLDGRYWNARWDQPNGPLLAASLVLLFFAVIGARAVFALPIALRANWIFRITAVHSPAAYFASVRKALLTLTAIPMWIVSAVLYLAIWPVRPALEHVALLVVTGILVVELSLYRFQKMPFACSYLPGKANLHVKLGAYGIGFLFVSSQGVQIEFWAMQNLNRFAVLFAILLAAAIWARRRTAELAASPHNWVQFEDVPPSDVTVLDLHSDGAWSREEAYIDRAGR